MSSNERKSLELELEELIRYKEFISEDKYIEGLNSIRNRLIVLMESDGVNRNEYMDILSNILVSLNINPDPI